MRNEICKLVQITSPTHKELKPRLKSIGEKIGTIIMRMPIQSINIPRNRMIKSIVINIPQGPKPKDTRVLVITWPHPALRKAPVNRLAATAIKTIMAVILMVP